MEEKTWFQLSLRIAFRLVGICKVIAISSWDLRAAQGHNHFASLFLLLTGMLWMWKKTNFCSNDTRMPEAGPSCIQTDHLLMFHMIKLLLSAWTQKWRSHIFAPCLGSSVSFRSIQNILHCCSSFVCDNTIVYVKLVAIFWKAACRNVTKPLPYTCAGIWFHIWHECSM